jgi:hypothetical protein
MRNVDNVVIQGIVTNWMMVALNYICVEYTMFAQGMWWPLPGAS